MIFAELAGDTLVAEVNAAMFPRTGDPELVTVPLPLKVVQSELVRYPDCEPLAA